MKLSAQELLNKFSKSTSHPIEVRRISMMIFDEANEKIREMSNKERKYLEADRKSTRLNSSHRCTSRMPSSA